MLLRVIIFGLVNFAALGIGGLATGKGVPSEWYQTLVKAPWTPPGWVFGFAWTTIMICFSFYVADIWSKIENKNIFLLLFGIQWILNVMWNPVFFHYHAVGWGLFIIIALSLCVLAIGLYYFKTTGIKTLLISPYFVWLLIATSLNAYIWIKN